MNGICTAHRMIGDRIQTATGTLMNVTAAASIAAMINYFNSYDKVRPGATASTTDTIPFEYDSEVLMPSTGSGADIHPYKTYFSVTVTDTEAKTAKTYLLQCVVDPTAVNTDPTLPGGVFVAMDEAFRAAQPTALGASRLHLNDTKVFVDSIIIKQ